MVGFLIIQQVCFGNRNANKTTVKQHRIFHDAIDAPKRCKCVFYLSANTFLLKKPASFNRTGYRVCKNRPG